jgi:hypothetical protein
VHTDPTLVRQWLKAVGAVAAGALTPMEVEAKLDALTPLLASEYPPEAFTRDSLVRTARATKFFPSFAEVCEVLDAVVCESRPPLPRLSAPPVQPRTPPSAEAIEANRAVVAALRAATKAEPPPPGKHATLSPAQLLAGYEAAAASGHRPSAIRAEQLRAQFEVTT